MHAIAFWALTVVKRGLKPLWFYAVSSRRTIMEIVWDGLIEAINHRLQVFPHGQHSQQRHAHSLLPKPNYSSNIPSPGNTGSPFPPDALICNIAATVCDFNPIWIFTIGFYKRTKKTVFTPSAEEAVYRLLLYPYSEPEKLLEHFMNSFQRLLWLHSMRGNSSFLSLME